MTEGDGTPSFLVVREWSAHCWTALRPRVASLDFVSSGNQLVLICEHEALLALTVPDPKEGFQCRRILSLVSRVTGAASFQQVDSIAETRPLPGAEMPSGTTSVAKCRV